MDVRETSELFKERRRAGSSYLEFLRVPSMSCGVYELGRGSRDLQSPHTEDEVYYIIRGRGTIRVASEDRKVSSGTVIFVPARTDHRFHDIEEDLSALVLFGPAEGTGRESSRGAPTRS